MKRKIYMLVIFMSCGLFFTHNNVSAKGLESLDLGGVKIIKAIVELIPGDGLFDRGDRGFGQKLWWPPQDPGDPPRARRNGPRHGGQHGGGVGAPLDGGLLALLAGAGIAYFGARNNRRKKE